MIQNSEISIVVQGPIIPPSEKNKGTRENLRLIRKHLPGSKIILSTWNNAACKDFQFDELHWEEDPGGDLDRYGINYNVTRQIVSTLRGLRSVQTEYAVKIRSDSTLWDNGFIRHFQEKYQRDASLEVFSDRVVCCEPYCRSPLNYPLLFHPSDIFQFGKSKDLLLLWDLPIPGPDDIYFSNRNDFPKCYRDFWRKPPLRLVEEQYIWTKCMEKSGLQSKLQCSWQINPSSISLSERVFMNNFVPVPPVQLGLQLPDRLMEYRSDSVYTHEDFIRFHEVDYKDGKMRMSRRAKFCLSSLAFQTKYLALRLRHFLNH